MTFTHIFFDIGGVLGTNGWDREQRAEARAHFELEEEVDSRHHEIVGSWESGEMSFDEYLDVAIFFRPRAFSREAFVSFMYEQSRANEHCIALARTLASTGRFRMMTLNNESAELNQHRIDLFGLREIFGAFLSSCWLGVRKPAAVYYRRALGIAQARPERSLFIDDREQNLTPAKVLGMHTILFTEAASLERDIRVLGVL